MKMEKAKEILILKEIEDHLRKHKIMTWEDYANILVYYQNKN